MNWKSLRSFACAVLLTTTPVTVSGTEEGWPEEVQDVAGTALSHVDKAYTYRPHEHDAIAAAGEAFDQTMSRLADLSEPSLLEQTENRQADSMIARLIIIAGDRANNPERHAEIRDTYFTQVKDPQRVIPAAPALRSEHVDESYRLAWEYYLLRPPLKDAVFKSQHRIVDALARIGNPESAITVTRAYEATASPGVPITRYIGNKQRFMMQILGRIPSAQSLEGLLQCVLLSRQQLSGMEAERRKDMQQLIDFDADEYARRLLTDRERFGTGQQWRQVVNEFPAQRQVPAERALLDEVRGFYKEFSVN